MFILLLWDIQPVNEALQLLPERFHLGVDTIQHLVLSDPVEQSKYICTLDEYILELTSRIPSFCLKVYFDYYNSPVLYVWSLDIQQCEVV